MSIFTEEAERKLKACPVCKWTADIDGNWETECGEAFCFEDGGPKENGARFCCFCGRTIIAVEYVDPPLDLDDDEEIQK